MNYDTVIVELLSRIQALERRLGELEGRQGADFGVEAASQEEKISTSDIRTHIERRKLSSAERGESSVTLKAGDIHRELKLKSRLPMVCNAMRQCMAEGDQVVFETPSGYSSTLEICYNLANREA